MTVKPSGQRVAKTAVPRKNRAKRIKRRKDAPLTPKERRCFFQLVACSSMFVLLVAIKLLLPARLAPWQAQMEAALQKNMDVQAVFSAVAQAVGGEKDATETMSDVYQAVFKPQETKEVIETVMVTHDEVLMTEELAINRLRAFRLEQAELFSATEAETAVPASTDVLYSDENLPENVSMEQAILGFDYCTPVSGTLSSSFGYREHPTGGAERFHYGVDLAAEQGTDIRCFADGTVKAVGESSSYGKYVIVSHAGGFDTLYAHCSRILASSGAEVDRGAAIAEVGETGMATGPHLHFELLRDQVYLNPVYYVNSI